MTAADIVGAAVVDSSAIVALLIDGGPTGSWVADQVHRRALAAPALMPFEAANILHRQRLSGAISTVEADLALTDLLDLRVDLWPFELLAARARDLRDNLTTYDASYVALAERLSADFVTLDDRLARAPGPRCAIRSPAGDDVTR